jgi:hypothetical protein
MTRPGGTWTLARTVDEFIFHADGHDWIGDFHSEAQAYPASGHPRRFVLRQ